MVILLQSLRDQFSSLYMGLHGEIYDRWAKDSCADLDSIRTVGVRPHRIESYCGAHECKHASGVSNFAQTPDGQRGKQIIIDTRSQRVRGMNEEE